MANGAIRERKRLFVSAFLLIERRILTKIVVRIESIAGVTEWPNDALCVLPSELYIARPFIEAVALAILLVDGRVGWIYYVSW
jgi:hypothetical protein